MDETSPTEAFDPTRRKLCADDTCIGVIGEDGRCGECGRTEAEAEAGAARLKDGAPVADDGLGIGDVAADSAGADFELVGGEAGGFDPTTRRLCDDGSCVGVVGDDGLCRACGRRSE